MELSTLNLARKWRSQTFDTLVGQDLVVKILKNSLYVGHYFPVYLFAGQRGCGKTSTARIFAASLNCAALETFREKPKDITIPCGVCDSCLAMQAFRHPDFIEIDAASHTGVDNMRTIIDASYYLPVLGRKKIYLIDEAHMLSKAAFNAMLKLFEEPPLHAHFILATTDPEKIIETVKSRCFTLFFDAIDSIVLATHLEHLCKQERIPYEHNALIYIARCAEGSARDAINILEMVRFSHPLIDKKAVLQILGHVDDQRLVNGILSVVQGDTNLFLSAWSDEVIQRASASYLWASIVRLMRGVLWYHYGVVSRDIDTIVVQELVVISASDCTLFLQTLYNIEPVFVRTGDQRGLLEFSLLQLSLRFKKNISNSSQGQSGVMPVSGVLDVLEAESVEECDGEEDDDECGDDAVKPIDGGQLSADELLVLCKAQFAKIEDQFLASILSQVVTIQYDASAQQYTIHFAAQHKFFADKLELGVSIWHPVISAVYQQHGTMRCVFDILPVNVPMVEKKTTLKPTVDGTKKQEGSWRTERSFSYGRNQQKVQEQKIDVSDIQRWPLTNRVLKYFPGTVTVVDEARI